MIRHKLKGEMTYGFELEGRFSYDLYNKVNDMMSKSGMRADWQHDCSVELRIQSGDCQYGEVAMGIYSNPNLMLKHLDIFTKENGFREDSSCGLHLHIKPRNERLRNAILDHAFIKHLQRWAERNLCERIKQRIKRNNRYCQRIRGIGRTREDWRVHRKYLFIRNHPIGTLEFRFLSPCEHKVDNINNFLNHFLLGLTDYKKLEKEQEEELDDEVVEELERNHRVEKQPNRNRRFYHKIGTEKEYRLRVKDNKIMEYLILYGRLKVHQRGIVNWNKVTKTDEYSPYDTSPIRPTYPTIGELIEYANS